MPHQNVAAAMCVLVVLALPSWAETPDAWAIRKAPELLEIYRGFHQTPELSGQEQQTASRLAQLLKQAGIDEIHPGVGGYGVVGVIKNGPGPTLLVRTDLDALPVTENTNLVYSSKVKVRLGDATTGVMHACGHDIHITNLIGVAGYLAAHKSAWSGTVVLIGQPAEEKGEGARKMLDDGLFTKFPRPEYALALHVDATLATGKVGYRVGYSMANVDSVNITMHGRSGHGASPHAAIDPIVQAAELVMSLQTLVSRETNPVEPAVVTVGAIQGGTKHNIIPDSCQLQLTVRSYTAEVRQHLLDGIRRKAIAVADGAGAPKPTVEILDETTPALFNDEKLVERLLPVLKKAVGENNVVKSEQSMGGEDFSRYGKAGAKIFMFRLGSVDPVRLAALERGGGKPPSLHSSDYYPDAEKTLVTGVNAMTAAVLDLLPPKK